MVNVAFFYLRIDKENNILKRQKFVKFKYKSGCFRKVKYINI